MASMLNAGYMLQTEGKNYQNLSLLRLRGRQVYDAQKLRFLVSDLVASFLRGRLIRGSDVVLCCILSTFQSKTLRDDRSFRFVESIKVKKP